MQQAASRFNLVSALTGFAIGAVVTFVAVVAVIPAGGRGNQGATVLAGDLESGGDEFVDGELLEDGSVASGGGGSTTRTVGGKSGGSTAAGTSSGSARTSGTTVPGRASGTTGGGSAVGGGGTGSGAGAGGGGGAGSAECAPGKNGGATDTGVSATQILLGATVAEEGIAKSFLGQVRQGMEAQLKKINRGGGVCGRQLKVNYKQDGWNPEQGNRFIENLVEQDKVFALAVSPSSEGLNVASTNGYFQKMKVPVVGADGLNVTQFKDPYIWPVAAATVTTVDVMMKDAFDRLGPDLRPVVVYGNGYRFGIEGAYAAQAAYDKLKPGSVIPGYKDPLKSGGCEKRFCGISPATGQYGTQVSTIKSACQSSDGGGPCNFMILLLEPKTALEWMSTPGVPVNGDFGGLQLAAPQPLFTDNFARSCGDKCNEMRLWTGYNPPIDRYQQTAPVAGYVADLKSQSAAADEFNQFTLGGYIGAGLLIEALKQVGANLTREALVAKLNSMAPYETGLAPPLEWRPNARYANHSAQAFKIEARNGFSNFALVREPLRDPWLGQHAV